MARTAEQFDGMVVHVRYEVVKLINFVRMSNHWPHVIGFELPDVYEVGGKDYGSLSTRLTDVGLDRHSTSAGRDLRWDEYFDETVPKVLRGFRYFMRQLKDHYAVLFMQARADLPRIDVVDGIDFVPGPADDT